MRKVEDINELRTLQMQIMDSIDEFCQQNRLSYSLAGGTLIGAIRHKGYIPWDDDIDIYMPRKDYNKFLAEYNGFNPRYKIYDWHNYPNMDILFAKVGDTYTELSEQGKFRDYGVNVDVFPLDGVSDRKIIRAIVFKIKTAIYILAHGKSQKYNINSPYKEKIRWIMSRLWPYSKLKSFRIIESIVLRWPNAKYVTNLISMGSSNPHDSFDLSIFNPTKEVPFENRKYRIMKGYDDYLTKRFGDYMKLPPENQRVHSHDLIAYIKG